MRIRVIDILELLAAGLSFEQILEELPDLELEHLKAALLYAVCKLDRPVLAAWEFGWILVYRQPLLCGLLLLLVKYISERTIGGIFLFYWVLYRNCDIIIGIVPQRRYNYKLDPKAKAIRSR